MIHEDADPEVDPDSSGEKYRACTKRFDSGEQVDLETAFEWRLRGAFDETKWRPGTIRVIRNEHGKGLSLDEKSGDSTNAGAGESWLLASAFRLAFGLDAESSRARAGVEMPQSLHEPLKIDQYADHQLAIVGVQARTLINDHKCARSWNATIVARMASSLLLSALHSASKRLVFERAALFSARIALILAATDCS